MKSRGEVNKASFEGMMTTTAGLKKLYDFKLSMPFMGVSNADAAVIGATASSIKAPNMAIQLKRNKIGPEGAKALARKIFENSSLISFKLNLSSYRFRNPVGDGGLDAFLEEIGKSDELQIIGMNFRSCGITAPKNLEKIFAKGHLVHLFLDMNPLHPDSFSDIISGLTSQTLLEQVSLGLNGTRVPPERLLGICGALEQHKNLRTLGLDLMKNGLKAKDVDSVLESLGKLTALKEINLNMEKNEPPSLSEEEILALFGEAEELVGINIKLEKDQ